MRGRECIRYDWVGLIWILDRVGLSIGKGWVGLSIGKGLLG